LNKNLIPDFLIRKQIKNLLKQRLKDENKSTQELQHLHFTNYWKGLAQSPIAIHTQAANEQHYEVPTEFYQFIMGKRMKYSSGYWKDDNSSFQESEDSMLELYIDRTEFFDGMKLLDLGCGWGSVSLYFAEKFPNSSIVGVSNSRTQKDFIMNSAKARGLKNIQIVTVDMNEFDPGIDVFDRIISIEMLEHMKNYEKLFEKLAKSLKNNGKIFIHIFTHKDLAYPFEVKDATDWMSKYFFTGGQMPSDDLLLYFQKDLIIEAHWAVDGTHYSRTSENWLYNMDQHKAEIMPILQNTYGKENALKWWVYWRIFFMSCSELFRYRNGREWFVSHYLFRKRV
jgi:cyclopropane-fatty-acyl-phospholipid synthase